MSDRLAYLWRRFHEAEVSHELARVKASQANDRLNEAIAEYIAEKQRLGLPATLLPPAASRTEQATP